MPSFTTRRRGAAKPLTTAQRLDRIIKSARQIMRKDKGLNGDLDRLPMLTWVMFLKFLDDVERIEETRAGLRRIHRNYAICNSGNRTPVGLVPKCGSRL